MIVSGVPDDVSCSLYVDDLAIYISSSNIPTVERRLQLTIDKISKWTKEHGFKLSTPKTVAVQFHRGRGIQREPIINLMGERIRFNTEHKFLGLIWDQRLRWNHHISDLKNKCRKSLTILKTLSHSNWGADRIALLRIYRSIIRSKLDYGCTIYASAAPHITKQLDSIHNQANPPLHWSIPIIPGGESACRCRRAIISNKKKQTLYSTLRSTKTVARLCCMQDSS